MKSLPFVKYRKVILPVLALSILVASCTPPGQGTTPVYFTPLPTATPAYMPCTVLPFTPDVSGAMDQFIDEYAHINEPDDASVTLLLFTTFQCPGCAALTSALEQVLQTHPGQVRLVVRYLPDARFDKNELTMQAAEAASLQGMFWEMYTLLFEHQFEWYALPPEGFQVWAGAQAGDLGMDVDSFLADMESEEVKARVQQALLSVSNIDFLPPLLYINSTTPYSGMADFFNLDQMVNLALLEQRKFHDCPSWILDPSRQVIVTLHTARGDAVFQLYPEKAPLAVNNFIYLARAGWYDGTTFFRLQAGMTIQGGDPSGTGYGNPGYYFQTEAAQGISFDHPGVLAMANAGVDTNGSQFFITYAPLPQLDGQFTIFGDLLTGMDVLESLVAGDMLLGVSVEER